MFERLAIVVSTALVLGTSAHAQSYVCEFKDASRHSVIAPMIRLDLSEDGQSAFVTDRMLVRRKLAPLEATSFTNDDKRIKASWHVKNAIGAQGAKANLSYSLVYRKKNGKAFVTFRASGYGNTNQGTGRCTVQS